MATTYINVSPKTFEKVLTQLNENHQDRTLVLTKPFLTNTYAPTTRGKFKGLHRLKFEVLIPEEAINGENALFELGAVMALQLPTVQIASEYLEDVENS